MSERHNCAMSLREAAQMALEWIRDEGIEWIGKGDEVKQVLRAALAESDGAELSDEAIIRMWYGRVDFPIPEIKEVVTFARAVLAAARGKG